MKRLLILLMLSFPLLLHGSENCVTTVAYTKDGGTVNLLVCWDNADGFTLATYRSYVSRGGRVFRLSHETYFKLMEMAGPPKIVSRYPSMGLVEHNVVSPLWMDTWWH